MLRKAIEEAEEVGEPDIAEIVREALEELEHPRNDPPDATIGHLNQWPAGDKGPKARKSA